MRIRVIWLTAVLLTGFMGFSPGHAQEVVNILDNGGFEDGVVAPWGAYGDVSTEVVQDLVGAAVTEDPIEGDSCLHITVNSAGVNFWDVGLQHRGHVFEQGRKYTLSAFLKCGEGTLRINFKPELSQNPWTGYGEQAFTMTEEWAEYSTTTYVFTEDLSPANITFHIGYAAGDFWIDGVKFYEGDYVPTVIKRASASSPNPLDGAIYEDTWASLSWAPGDTAASHDVYFGDDFEDVSNGTGGTLLGNQSATNLVVGSPGSLYPDSLVPGTTYYWRIDEVEADGTTVHKGVLWSFSLAPRIAHAPEPADGAQFVNPKNVILNWAQGSKATLHYVYFGDDFDTVNNAAGELPQEAATFAPGPLEFEKTYYWRVDEFDDSATYKGEVWSFRTAPETTTMITGFSRNKPAVGRYEKFELTFALSESYDNPFDPDIVDVLVTFTGPDANTVITPAFFYMEYDMVGGKYVNGHDPCWKARFAPSLLGRYTVTQITIRDDKGIRNVDPHVSFTCLQSERKGIIRVDQRDPYCLRYDDGSAYLPIGHNVAWDPDGGIPWWEQYFASMRAVGENWTRIWMTHFYDGHTLEWSSKHHTAYFKGVGWLSLQMAGKIDQMIELAEQNGIGVQLVFQHHGQFSTTVNPNWNENPYNIANAYSDGGFLINAEDFFTDIEAVRLSKYKYRYILARWGYSDAILTWELWNEVQYTDAWRKGFHSDVVNWHEEMAGYLQSVDPFNHLITTSSDGPGFEAIWSLANMDFVQVHHYGSGTISFFEQAAASLSGYEKPVIMGEFGSGVSGAGNAADFALTIHNGIWSAFHLKSSAHCWWWEQLDSYNFYDKFIPLSAYAEGEDLAAHNLSRADISIPGASSYKTRYLQFIGLSGTDHAYIWVYDVGSRKGQTDHGVFTDVNLVLKGLDNGSYVIDFYETRGTGGVVGSNNARSENGSLVIALPQFTKDIAVKVKPLGTPSTEDSEGFETGNFGEFDWMSYGDEDWAITSAQSYSGTYSAQAGSIGRNESSALEVTLDCISGDIRFYYKVSSESDFDYLRFYIDDEEQNRWSGEENWTEVSLPVTEGRRTFKWAYSKDGSDSEGDDTAWIDDIVFPAD